MMSEQRYNRISNEILSLQADCQQLCVQKECLEREYASGMDRYLEGANGNVRVFQSKMEKAINNCVKQYNKKMDKMYKLQMQIRMDRGI